MIYIFYVGDGNFCLLFVKTRPILIVEARMANVLVASPLSASERVSSSAHVDRREKLWALNTGLDSGIIGAMVGGGTHSLTH